MITGLLYYGINIKRNSFINNWNIKSNFLDFNLEVIIFYFYSSFYLFYFKNENFLRRFHKIKNRNKILKEHHHIKK